MSNDTRRVSAALSRVLAVLSPDDEIAHLEITRAATSTDIEVTWTAGHLFRLTLHSLETDPEIVYRIFWEMQDSLAESPMGWSQPRPPCPGHAHPRTLLLEGHDLWWQCPTDASKIPAFRPVNSP